MRLTSTCMTRILLSSPTQLLLKKIRTFFENNIITLINIQMEEAKQRVLVTGISGYIAAECAYQLLEKGYKVRGTVRSTKNELKLAPIKALHPACENDLELVEANLNSTDGWA